MVEAAVDFARRAPPGAQGLRFERGNVVALLHDFDDFENVFGSSEKNIGVPRGDLVVDLMDNTRMSRINRLIQKEIRASSAEAKAFAIWL